MSLISSFASSLGLSCDVDLSSDGRPVPIEDEEMKASVPNVSIVCGNMPPEADGGPGTLFVTTRRVVWVSNTSSSADAPPRNILALGYPQIVMHAISRDPKPCIYLQLDDDNEGGFIGAADGAQALATEANEEEEEEGEVNPEVRIVPSDPASVEEIFKALCDCAALNPDPEDEGEGDFYFDEGEVMNGLDDETKAALLASRAEGMEIDAEEELEELVGDDPGRFEEDEEEVNGVAGSEK